MGDNRDVAKSRSAPPTPDQKRLAAQRAAAARDRIQAEQRRRRIWTIAAAVGTVVVIVAVFIVVKVALGSDVKSGKKSAVASVSLTSTLAGIPSSAFDTVGVGTTQGAPEPATENALGTSKPEVLYIGAEFCPFCAAERWPVAVALSRFGSFTNLGTTYSSPSDTNPNTPTLTFHGASYTSKYLTFVGKEVETNQVNAAGDGYTPLDKLTAAQATLFKKDANNSFPFLDMNGRFTLNSAQYDGIILAGMTPKQVANAIDTPSSTISKAVLGSANVLTARLCQVTKEQPAAVCSSSGVQTAATAIAKSS